MKRERGFLRDQASLAKQRLMGGNFGLSSSDDSNTVVSLNTVDNELYSRVTSLIAGGIVNPLGHLLDKCMMERMSVPERERYVLSMSTKVRELCEKYWMSMAV